MTHEYLLAVDPGKHGAIAIFAIATGAPVDVLDFPLTPANEIAYGTLADMVVPYRGKAIAVIETTYSFKMGRNSAMHFGEVLGAWRGVLAASDIDLAQSLDPATWKKALGLSPDKEQSLVMARQLYPAQADSLKRKKDHDRAEALLIGHYFLGARYGLTRSPALAAT
jgi:crossover junction endodeoxyribonuclease RuvC